jgi:probable DNA metabolism protein
MQIVRLASETDFEGWRIAARSLLVQGIPPENLDWRVGESCGLFDTADLVANSMDQQQNQTQTRQFKVPRDFIALCRKAILHSDPSRFGLLYRLLWRMQQEPRLLQVSFDADVVQLQTMVKAVQRDLHKMKAFVRFREIESDGGESEFVAWFEPSHHIVEASAAFFTGRFTNMRWSILTPEICMHWDGKTLSYSAGARKADAPAEDAGEDLWRSYYRSIFNPARLKVAAMQSQMPKKYWRNLPEAPLIAELILNSAQRMNHMIAAQPTEPQRKIVTYKPIRQVPDPLANASDAAKALHILNEHMLSASEFPLAANATQAVLGTGMAPARIMLLGEQPGEQEDLSGQPFIGPAGQLLDRAMHDAGIVRSEIYITNTLKHYKFKRQGTRRMHLVPGVDDINTYLPWLLAEIAIVQPQIIVALGKVAARAITGEAQGMEASRGKLVSLLNGGQAIVTYHPSYILRTADQATKRLRYETLVADLKLAVNTQANQSI